MNPSFDAIKNEDGAYSVKITVKGYKTTILETNLKTGAESKLIGEWVFNNRDRQVEGKEGLNSSLQKKFREIKTQMKEIIKELTGDNSH